MKRLSEPRAAITSRFTEPTSVTAQSSAAASSASAARPGSGTPGRRRRPAPPPRPPRATRLVRGVDRPELPGPLEQLPVGVESGHLGVEPGAGGEPDRPTDQADAEDGDLHRAQASRRFRTAEASRSRVSTVVVPAHAGVGDRLAVDQRRRPTSRSWRPSTRKLSIITPTIAPSPAAICSAISLTDARLALVVLAAVAVAGVDHHPLRQARRRAAARASAARVSAS